MSVRIQSIINRMRRNSRVRESDKVHLNYAKENNKKRNTPVDCLDQGDHVCCADVWGGFMKDTYKKAILRDCTKAETFQLNFFKVFAKQLVSTTLFALVVWYIYITANLREPIEGVDNVFPVLFNCDPDSDTSIIVVDGVAGDFEDGGRQFCYFKSCMILLSFILLFPFMLETISVLTIIWVSSINSAVLVPIVDGKYVGKDVIFNNCFSVNVFKRVWECTLVLFTVPREILRLNKETETPVPQWLLLTEMVWKLVVFMVPDVLLTASLFPVSYYVMITSDSPEDILVNLVAVQVFAELDDIFVRMMFTPRSSCGERVSSYVTEQPFAPRAVYSPFQAYLLNEVRHQMGIKVPKRGDMNYYHEYTGHHLTANQ